MKKLIIAIAVAAAAILASSCTTVSNITVANSAVVDQANFTVVGPVSTTVKASYVFGIGGNKAKAAVEDAVIELTKKLGPNQGLAYITVVESNKVPLLPFVITKTFKVSGVIVQYQ